MENFSYMYKKQAVICMMFLVVVLSGCGFKKPLPSSAPPAKAVNGISMAAIAEHKTPDDCWLVINNNIYNLTDYLALHPAGEDKIISYCGQDATVFFETRPQGTLTPHSDEARSMLAKYYIGDLAR